MRDRPLRANWIYLFAFIALVLTGCQSFKPGYEGGVYHTVQEGQTLYSIARAYGVNVQSLAHVNRLRDPSHLDIGQRLWIPNATHVAEVPTTVAPHVHAGKPGSKPAQLLEKKSGPKIARKPESLPESKSSSQSSAHPKLNFIWPVKGGILTSRFGIRNGSMHEGLDIGAKEGTPIRAAADGTVMFSGQGPTGYGLMVIIKHEGNIMTVYSHNHKNYVYEKMRVQEGQMVGAVGSTGRATGPHLHFEVRNDTHPKDPLLYLPKL